MPGPIGIGTNNPIIDSGTLARTASRVPGPTKIESDYSCTRPDARPQKRVSGDTLDFRDYCPATRSKLCSDTLERIRRVYGTLDEIRVVVRKNTESSIRGGVDPGSPKTILLISTEDIEDTIRHELVHVRQYAEIFGNVTDEQRRRKLQQMASGMTQNEWMEWNFKLELEAYQIGEAIGDELKSPLEKRAAEEKLEAAAKGQGMSVVDFQEMFINSSMRRLLRSQYEEKWINHWKLLRGELELSHPPYIPKPTLSIPKPKL